MDSGFVAALVGMVVVLVAYVVSFLLSSWREGRQAKQLVASLAAQAQLETARAIREANREFDTTTAPVNSGAGSRAAAPDLEIALPQTGGTVGAVDRFYAQALLQANVWFLASVLAALVGLTVIVWEVIQAGIHPALDAVVKTSPGLLTGVIAALFYRQANATASMRPTCWAARRATAARRRPLTVLNSIDDVERRQEIAARLAMHLAGAPAPVRRSAGQARAGAERAATTRPVRRRPPQAPAAPAEHDRVE